MLNIIPTEHALAFIVGGRAQFVLWNQDSGNRFEYKVLHSTVVDTAWNVYHKGVYVGTLYNVNGEVSFRISKGVTRESLWVKAITWYLKRLIYTPKTIPSNVVLYHLGRCGVCGRKLKDPESIRIGIGPVCRSV